jgi:nucleotide-binding universal stress UspA family protein
MSQQAAVTIVVGWTPDEFGETALHRAVEEARLRDGRVVVVNATRGDALVDDRYADEDQLAALAAELGAAGVEVDVRRSMGADVGDQVLAVADDVSADLVVIGLRRRSPVGKLLMGSVAQRILLGADCAVLAVKPVGRGGRPPRPNDAAACQTSAGFSWVQLATGSWSWSCPSSPPRGPAKVCSGPAGAGMVNLPGTVRPSTPLTPSVE